MSKKVKASELAAQYVPSAFNAMGIDERRGWISRNSQRIEKMRSNGLSDDAIRAKLFNDEEAAKRESKRIWRRLPRVPWKGIGATLGALAIVGGGVATGLGVYAYNMMPDSISALPSRSASDEISEPTDGDTRNIVVVGVDRRGMDNSFGEGNQDDVPGSRTDTIMLVNISGDGSSISGVSIPRDSYVSVDGCRNYNLESGGYTADKEDYNGRINAAYNQGGPECTVKAVESLTGVTADSYIEADFKAFSEAVNAIGGVDVCVENPIVDDELGTIISTSGRHVLNGEQALNYARARKVEGTGKSDFDRISRQQQIIASAFSKMQGNGLLSDAQRVAQVLPVVSNNFRMDGLSINDIASMARSVSGMKLDSMVFRTAPISGENPDGTLNVNKGALRGIVSSFGDPVDERGKSRGTGVLERSKTDVTIRTSLGGDKRAMALRSMLINAGFSSVNVTVTQGEVPEKTSVIWSTGHEKDAAALVQALPNAYVKRASKPGAYGAVIEMGESRAGRVADPSGSVTVSLPLEHGETRKNSTAVEKFGAKDPGTVTAKSTVC